MDTNTPTTASDADIAHLFGIKQPFLAPLHLSYPLNQARRLSADEATQLCERDSAIKPTTREGWQIAPLSINGVPHVELSKMTTRGGARRIEASWHLPRAPGEGLFRLSAPLGSGRALTQAECRQLRSIGGEFKGANPAWTVTPSPRTPLGVEIFRYKRNVMQMVGALKLAMPVAAPSHPVARPAARPALTVASKRVLDLVF